MPEKFSHKVQHATQFDGGTSVQMPVAKATSAIALAGLTWSDLAAAMAAIYTSLLLGEWLWRRTLHAPYRRWRTRRKQRGKQQGVEPGADTEPWDGRERRRHARRAQDRKDAQEGAP